MPPSPTVPGQLQMLPRTLPMHTRPGDVAEGKSHPHTRTCWGAMVWGSPGLQPLSQAHTDPPDSAANFFTAADGQRRRKEKQPANNCKNQV